MKTFLPSLIVAATSALSAWLLWQIVVIATVGAWKELRVYRKSSDRYRNGVAIATWMLTVLTFAVAAIWGAVLK